MRYRSTLTLFYLLLFPQVAICAPLTLSYFERPPYYYTEAGQATGFLLELTRSIFQDAGLETEFKSLPPNRIMREIKQHHNAHCSIGWFKNPERETYAKFSLPIYQNKPVVLLTTKKQRALFASYKTLRQVFADKALTMATLKAFSYGAVIDRLIEEGAPRTRVISGQQNLLPKLLMKGRASYMLTAPEEIDMLIRSAELQTDAFIVVTMEDIPTGNKRYLMCNQAVGNSVIEKINRSILKLTRQNSAE